MSIDTNRTHKGDAMPTKTKPRWSLAEALEQLPTIGSGPPDAERRAMLVEGRTLAEHDRIIGEIGYDANAHWLLHRLAELDHAQAKAASTSGAPVPATPYLEELTRRNADMTSTKAPKRSSNGSARTKTASNVRFAHDGKVMPDSQNKLSSVAYYYTKGLGKNGGRLRTSEFEALLAKLGVKDTSVAGWSVTLPNGVVIAAVKNGETPTAVSKPEPTKAAANATATSKPSLARAKAANAKKATKPKATKKQGAASKPLAKKMAPRKALAKSVPARKATKSVTRKA